MAATGIDDGASSQFWAVFRLTVRTEYYISGRSSLNVSRCTECCAALGLAVELYVLVCRGCLRWWS